MFKGSTTSAWQQTCACLQPNGLTKTNGDRERRTASAGPDVIVRSRKMSAGAADSFQHAPAYSVGYRFPCTLASGFIIAGTAVSEPCC